ncbi:MAG: hypothetical protein KAT75_02040, partial [Dehalococcoidia bacterium]|nr:hypothetical protein [Dehalococcoidia bacterium]
PWTPLRQAYEPATPRHNRMWEVKVMSTIANANSSSIQPTVRALGQLSPSSQGAVVALAPS